MAEATRADRDTVPIAATSGAPTATSTGRVAVRRGSKTVKSWRRLKDGKFSVTVRRQPTRRHQYTVRYSGSSAVEPATQKTVRVRVR